MQHIPDQAGPRATAAVDVTPDDDVGERRAWPADAILDPAAPSAPTLAACLLARRLLIAHGPRAALAAWLVGVVWLVGSHFAGSPLTLVQQETMQSAGIGDAVRKIAEEPHTQKEDLEFTGTLQSPGAKDAVAVGRTMSHPGPAKTEMSAAVPEVSGKVEHTRKSAEKPAKPRDRVDRIGLEIAALLAADPSAKSSRSVAPVIRKSAHGGRGDAFDPSQNPAAPGAPRPLGAIAAPAIANDMAAQGAAGRRTD